MVGQRRPLFIRRWTGPATGETVTCVCVRETAEAETVCVCLRERQRGKHLTWCQLGAHIVPFPRGEAVSETLNHFIHFKPILLFLRLARPASESSRCLLVRAHSHQTADESGFSLRGLDAVGIPCLASQEVKRASIPQQMHITFLLNLLFR